MSNVRHLAWRPLRVVLISATLVLAACGDKPQQQDMAGMKVPVNVVQVQPEVTPLFVELPGRVDAIEEAQVRARVDGVVEAINFEQGAEVKAGDLLFTIDPAPYVAALDQASAQLKNAQAAVQSASSLAQRYTKLIKENAVSRQEYDNAVAQYEQARANVELAKATLEAAKINLGYTKVTAPISGRIGRAEVTKGALVSAAQATHLATIQRIDELYVDITRPVSEVMALRKAVASGMLKADDQGQAHVTALYDDRSMYSEQGKLLFSGIAVDPLTGQLNMRALFPNPNQELLPGMFVRVRLEQAIKENALLVPAQAVQYSTSGAASLMIVENDAVKTVSVKLGNQIDGRIIVNEGLEPGATVIVAGFQKIRPGVPVQALPWNDGAPAATQPASSSADNG